MLDAVEATQLLLAMGADEASWRAAFPDPARVGQLVRQVQRRAGVRFPGAEDG